MNERTLLISEYLVGDFSVSELARRRAISRKTVYKWIDRYEQENWAGLKDRSRAPNHHPQAISVEMERCILEWKAKRPLWGAPKIHSKLVGLAGCPAESTVSNVLARHGLTRAPRRRRRAMPNTGPLVESCQPNDTWCADFKGWFRTGNSQRCDPLTISDAYSRYLLCCQGIAGGTGWRAVQPLFIATFQQYGLPLAIRTDNGPPFASVGLGGLSQLSVWWLRLGVRLERIQPGHPEQNGRHERLHRTLKEEAIRPAAWNLARQQDRFDAFTQDYNYERPHEALGQKPPAALYTPSLRDYPSGLPEVQYPTGWLVRAVRSNGEIKWRGDTLYLSQSLHGQRVGLEPVGDGLWKIHFTTLALAILDERLRAVTPLVEPARTSTKNCNPCP